MIQLENLRVEYLREPPAVAEPRPRFSWELTTSDPHERPQSYRLIVESDGVPLWDSGPRDGASVALVAYEGRPLPPDSVIRWTVEVSTSTGAAARESATFDTAPLIGDWDDAHWITLRRPQYQHDDFRPAPYLRTIIRGGSGVVRARLHMTAGGVFEPWVNGRRLGHSSLLPGWTDYGRHVFYHSWDITDRFADDEDVVVGAVVADGWYAGGVGPFHKRSFWGKHPVVRAIAVLEHADGRREVYPTGDSWEAEFGAVQSADLLQGEVIDARRALGDWSRTFGGWRAVSVEAGPQGALIPAVMRGPATVAVLPTIRQWEPEPGTVIVDFGQNHAGHIRLGVTGAAGTVIRVRHGEALTEAGDAIYTDNLRGARATDTFILSGGDDEFEPAFTYHGYRYAELTGLSRGTEWSIASIAISSIDELTGEIETGDPLIERIQRNIRWSMLSNFIEVPTDCPSRDERTGWTGDAQIFARTAMLNADLGAFYSKWLGDVDDTRMANGSLPDIAPAVVMDWAREGSSGYAEAGIIVPWEVYQAYGDRRVLERFLDPARAWVQYILERAPDLIWRTERNTDYGDWLAPVETRKDLTATAYFARSAQLVAEYADVLGLSGRSREHRDLHRRIAEAFRREFVDDDGRMPEGTQTALVLALRFDLLLPHQRAGAFAQLADDVERRGHLTTGFLAVQHLLPVLTEHGRPDLAYALLLRKEYPSWGYQIAQGATTMWERWDGWRPETGFQDPLMNSFNHFAVGSVGQWLYEHMVGLSAALPGWERVRVRPAVNRTVGFARARVRTIRGWVEAGWRLEGEDVVVTVETPPGVRCDVMLPWDRVTVDGTAHAGAPVGLPSGIHALRGRVVGRWSENGTLLPEESSSPGT